MRDTEFIRQYGALTPSQKKAVDAIEGPVMVIAGPGTGKTQLLALRIGNILRETDTAPEQILALTFTESGVSEMRRRLISFIGETAYRVPIHTFHGFCNMIIGRFANHFPQFVGSESISELDRILLMQKVFDNVRPSELRSFRNPYYYVHKALSAISDCKRENLSPDALEERVRARLAEIQAATDYLHEKGAHKGKVRGEYKKEEEHLARVHDLAQLYRAYAEALAKAQTYDYDDMILGVVSALESDNDNVEKSCKKPFAPTGRQGSSNHATWIPGQARDDNTASVSDDLKLILQEEYQYILADEHQDANGAQNRVLELLSDFHDSPNLFVVGDEKQAIYRFQGASLANFLSFQERWPEARLITLTDNFRSHQEVLDIAHEFLGVGDASPLPRPRLVAQKNKGGIVRSACLLDLEQETAWVARDIQQKIEAGAEPEEIVLFTRTNAELARFGGALDRLGVLYSLSTKEDVLDDPLIERLLLLLRAVADFGEESALVRAMHVDCLGIDELDIFLLARRAAKERAPLVRLACAPDAPESILEFCRKLKGWAGFGANHAMAELVSLVVRESGLLTAFLAKPERLAKLSVLFTFLEEHQRANRSARLPELLQAIAILDEYNVLKASGDGSATGRVRLMTAHRGKGLGFAHVYVTGLQEGTWGNRTSRVTFHIPGLAPATKEEEEQDERRLFYVALTRVKATLTLTYAETREDGKEALPSRYLAELSEKVPGTHLKRYQVPFPRIETVEREESVELAAARFAPDFRAEEGREALKTFVRETLLERGLSVTHLNNYLTCPWQWFYRNLLRVPEPQNKHLMFGNAMHATLQWFFDAWKAGEDPGKTQLVERLHRELERQSFTAEDLADARQTGEQALCGYYDTYRQAPGGGWPRMIENERAVDILFPVDDVEIRLNGKLDKLERGEDAEDERVTVIDYKTGKPKSENVIRGKTADSNGDYYRQLVFYKLLLDRYVEGKYDMRTGVIDFVEPDSKSGKYKQYRFTIETDEVRVLEETVRSTIREMLALEFWEKRCGDKECAWCPIRPAHSF